MKKFLKRVLRSVLLTLTLLCIGVAAAITAYVLQQNGVEYTTARVCSICAWTFIALMFVLD